MNQRYGNFYTYSSRFKVYMFALNSALQICIKSDLGEIEIGFLAPIDYFILFVNEICFTLIKDFFRILLCQRNKKFHA